MLCCVLVSGGKDSGHCLSLLPSLGHTAVCLANLTPAASEVDELDSMMFQTAGHRAVGLYSALTGLPLYRKRTEGKARDQGLAYEESSRGDEVEDLWKLLRWVKRRHPEVEAVVSGAILSDYQRLRVEACCSRLGLTSIAPLWQRDQGEVLDEMIDSGLRAVLLKVACFGLEPKKHLGLDLSEARQHLHELHSQIGCHICGEGGEYETLVLGGPCFKDGRTLALEETEIVEANKGDGVGWIAVHGCRAQDADGNDVSDDGLCVYIDDDEDPELDEVGLDDIRVGGELDGFEFDVAERAFEGGAFVAVTPVAVGDPFTPTKVDGVAQFRALLACLEETLDELGFDAQQPKSSSLRNVAFVALYVADMAGYAQVNAAYVARFVWPHPPSRLCVQVPSLPAGAAVALECLAFHPSVTGPRRALHVQSVSAWATACIGPYAQANVVGDRLALLAGAIPLDPPTMRPVGGGLYAQADLCARNVRAVAECVAGKRPTRPLACTVFATSDKGVHAAASSLAPARVTLGVVVPALPRGVDIEVRPVLLLDDDENVQGQVRDEGGEGGGVPWTLEAVPATVDSNAGEWLVHARGTAARGRLLRLTLTLVARQEIRDVGAACAACAGLAAKALPQAGLAKGHVVSVAGHHARDEGGMMARAMEDAFASLGLGCVSIQSAVDLVHLGIDVPDDLGGGPALAVDLLAWRPPRAQ